MRNAIVTTAILAAGCFLSGCAKPSADSASAKDDPSAAAGPASPAAIESGVVSIGPQNTKVDFLGTKPDGRHVGGFSKFDGKIQVDPESRALQEIAVEIETDSLWSDNEKLTAHLKSADFFDVREHPTASFRSTAIEAKDADAGEYLVTGDLTLLGKTKSIGFPAKATIDADRLKLASEFKIDRTDFGMTYGEGKVDRDVTITVNVGVEPQAEKKAAADSRGPAGGRGPGGPGGRKFDPEAFFKERDANGDGKLSGDEISEPMRQRLDATDKNGDGEVSREEWQERIRERRSKQRGGPPRAGGDEKTAPAEQPE